MNNKKKFRYIKIKDEPPKKRNNRKKEKVMRNIGHALTVVGTTISSMLLVLVIMMCIVVTVVTVYILDFADMGFDANLRDIEMKMTSMVYAYDADGQAVELKRLAREENRVWVNYEDISINMINATVAHEDKRFWDHKGVDWRRTVFALGADVLKLDQAGQGGSTITQQLIKNLTGDKEQTYDRKLREIFRALSLEKKYSKDDILESYLNQIWFGRTVYGIGAASNYYFGKDASELDIAEAAILAGMIRNPGKFSPYVNLTNCKTYQLSALTNMYEQGLINAREYEAAKVEKVQFARVVYGDDFGYIDPRSIQTEEPVEEEPDDDTAEVPHEAYRWYGDYEVSQNWYVDAAIEQVINDYADLKGITYISARNEIYNGGYKIYTNMDMEMQAGIEEKFKDPHIALTKYNVDTPEDDLLQGAMVIMDYSGTVLALAGGIGDKPGDNCFNRATMATRAPGSTMKPIGPYSMGIQNNIIYYSQMIPDIGITILDEEHPGKSKIWPDNYEYEGGDGSLIPVWYAVRKSRNTTAVRVAQQLTPQVIYNQLTQNLGLSTLETSDIALSPVTLGALTNGVKMVELAAAYQEMGNGGLYYEPMLYSRVLDSKNNVILEQNFYGTMALDSDTAWITNRLMRTVVTDPAGSGRRSDLGSNIEIVGKTGTSNSMTDLLFVGLTPNHVGVVWVGNDKNKDVSKISNKKYLAQIWHDVMVDVEDPEVISKFSPDTSALERRYCVETGLLASIDCADTEIGYYRASNLPPFCSGNHEMETEKIYEHWNEFDQQIADRVNAILSRQ